MNPRISRTAVFDSADSPLRLTDVPVPDLRAGECLVRVTACTLCGSDLHSRFGRRPNPVPSVLGHEIIGVVEAVHPDTDGLPAVGQRVTWGVAASCHHCSRCVSDMPQKCRSLFKYGHENSDVEALSGGLSEYCVLRAGTTVVPIPDHLPDAVACPASCATATVAAALHAAGDLHGKRVLITGAGMLGLTATAMAGVNGAQETVVCDIDAVRRQRAVEMGADEIVQAVPDDRFDVVFEMTGNSGVVEQTFNVSATGGTVVLVGSVSPSRDVSVSAEQIVRGLMTIRGVHNYRPDDLRTAVEFLVRHHKDFPLNDLVETWFPLADVNAAMDRAEQGDCVRVGVRPERTEDA